jgi:hypothetical protein
MLVFRQFLGDRAVRLGGGLLLGLLADEDRPGGAAGRVPHERDRDRTQPVGAPGARLADLRSEAGRDLSRQALVIEHRLLVPSGNSDIGLQIVGRAQRAYRAEGARSDLSQLRDIGGGTDRRLTQILLPGIGPADPLHVDLGAGVLLLEDIERLRICGASG